jgi:hypothetical protein
MVAAYGLLILWTIYSAKKAENVPENTVEA